MSDLTVKATAEQIAAWTNAAGDVPLEEWVAAAADAAVPSAYVEPITIALRHPIKHGARMVEQLVVRPIKAKYLRPIKATDHDMSATLAMASKLTGEPPQVIDELEGEDLREVLKAVNGFFFAIR